MMGHERWAMAARPWNGEQRRGDQTNAAHMIRRFEAGGFEHDQAVCLAETITDEVDSTVATRESVELAIERAARDLVTRDEFLRQLESLRTEVTDIARALGAQMAETARLLREEIDRRLEPMASKVFVDRAIAGLRADILDRMNQQTRWLAGIAILQTVAIITGTVTMLKLLGG